MKIKTLLILSSLAFTTLAIGQEAIGPQSIATGNFIGKTIPLRDMPTIYELERSGFKSVREIKQRFDKKREFENFNPGVQADEVDPVAQTEQGTRDALNVLQNFQGASVQEGQAIPPDPTGAVGPNHYVHAVNLVVKIFDKTGNLLTGPTFLGTFLGSGNNNGDPIVMYDQLADRFFVSQFRVSDNALIIGVSETPDPTGAYNVYEYPLDAFPDYPHYSIWHNGYYLTANKNGGNTTYALDRAAMLNGDPNPAIIGFNLPGVVRNPATVFSPEPGNLIGNDFDPDQPAYVVYLQDSSWPSITEDHLKVWELRPDFDTPSASTISAPLIIPTAPFDSFFRVFGQGDFEQPVTPRRIDGASGVISYASNIRKFPDYDSWVVSFNADQGSQRGGIRWIELRKDATSDWTIFQESTYAPEDGDSRFMSSTAMDVNGNIALAYNVSSENTNPSIRFTGRFSDDPLGVMTFPETSIIEGGGYQTTTNRFGDYAHMSMDPDGTTFWHTSQYFSSNNQWRTRIASFQLNGTVANDIGVFNFVEPVSGELTANETVTVRIYNFGQDPQSNFDVTLRLNGDLIATETFTGTIAPNEEATYTFNTTLDLSQPQEVYEITAASMLTTDSNIPNDGFTITINNTILSAQDAIFANNEFAIYPAAPKVYNVNFAGNQDFGDIAYTVHNTLGQQILKGGLEQNGTTYTGTLNFSANKVGVYFVTLNNGQFQTTKRVIVN